jgi:hypothetical protein
MVMDQNARPGKRIILVGAGLFLLILSSIACEGLAIGGGDEGNPIPTPIPAEDVGEEAQEAAQDTPEATWDNYVRDIIAEQVAHQKSKLSLDERYQRPDVTEQNLGGIVTDIDLLEDRTEFDASDTYATVNAEFDVKLNYANGDSESRTCRFTIGMEYHADSETWYVVNPEALAVFAVCG